MLVCEFGGNCNCKLKPLPTRRDSAEIGMVRGSRTIYSHRLNKGFKLKVTQISTDEGQRAQCLKCDNYNKDENNSLGVYNIIKDNCPCQKCRQAAI